MLPPTNRRKQPQQASNNPTQDAHHHQQQNLKDTLSDHSDPQTSTDEDELKAPNEIPLSNLAKGGPSRTSFRHKHQLGGCLAALANTLVLPLTARAASDHPSWRQRQETDLQSLALALEGHTPVAVAAAAATASISSTTRPAEYPPEHIFSSTSPAKHPPGLIEAVVAAPETTAASSPPPEPVVAEDAPTATYSPAQLLESTLPLPLSPAILEAYSICTCKLLEEELGLSAAYVEAIDWLTTTFNNHTTSPESPNPAVPEPVSTSPPDNNGSLAGPQRKRHKANSKDFELMFQSD
ncbi:hypothetical protein PtA15_2A117 [Puccinia triticina]|uniref:Uncharacterized protein n=1 Tax=Puccinia triticina TaxID=208348 RepID=A0ABY7C9G1_9BASI|nr:uncharacterized protein PtA15_2A117 [Puccinia triticina]WAQ81805.1 hypothetical protein PtA15_2A117 [Puccinia triticina]